MIFLEFFSRFSDVLHGADNRSMKISKLVWLLSVGQWKKVQVRQAYMH
jgi:hypothetical protein